MHVPILATRIRGWLNQPPFLYLDE
jgi:hypothetical protein